jgi:acetolactate synthase-1/2/3 large subunit
MTDVNEQAAEQAAEPGADGAAARAEVTHGGAHAVAAARQHGVTTMFTLSGGHVFPLYDGAVKADPPMRLVDVRHEQTAVFAAEATARLTRTPGFAVVTAGPGVTNAVSAVTTAHFNGSPVVVLGGRAPDYRWGSGSLQEMDHPPLLAPVTKRAWTEHEATHVGAAVDESFRLATAPHPGPVFLDIALEALFGDGGAQLPGPAAPQARPAPDAGDVDAIAGLVAAASRPVLVLGSDVWLGGAEAAARAAAEELRLPVIANGQGRGVLPAGHELLVTRARSVAFAQADLVVVVGAPLDFRLGYGEFGGGDGRAPARVVHVADSPDQLARHATLAASGGRPLTCRVCSRRWPGRCPPRCGRPGPAWPGRTPGSRNCRPRPPRRWPPIRPCWAPPRTRSTRCASTVSCPGCWRTMRW